MFEEYLQLIAVEKTRVKHELQPPASENELAALTRRTQDTFEVELPSAYLDFLAKTNGLTHNGLHLYGACDGCFNARGRARIFEFVSANMIHRGSPYMTTCLAFGNDPELYLWNTEMRTFHYCTSTSVEEIEAFSTCEDLLRFALKRCLT